MISIPVTITRPNNTTQYAAGEVITQTTPVVLTFEGASRLPGGNSMIIDAIIMDSANQTLKLSAELWLFTAAPVMDDDNAVFTPTSAELLKLIGIMQFSTAFVGDAAAGASGNCALVSEHTYLPQNFQCASGLTSIYGVLITRNAYTPIANEVLTIILKVLYVD